MVDSQNFLGKHVMFSIFSFQQISWKTKIFPPFPPPLKWWNLIFPDRDHEYRAYMYGMYPCMEVGYWELAFRMWLHLGGYDFMIWQAVLFNDISMMHPKVLLMVVELWKLCQTTRDSCRASGGHSVDVNNNLDSLHWEPGAN